MMHRLPKLKLVLFLVLFLGSNILYAEDPLHDPFTSVLSESVVDGQVDYPIINNNPAFFNYLKSLETKPSFKSKNEELAFWINAYNALAIKGILDKRSPRTLLGRYGYFKKAKYNVGDLSLIHI